MASRPPLLRAPSHVDDEEEEFDDGQPVHLTITTHNENGEDDEQSCTSPRIDSAEQLIAAAISATVCPEDAKSGIPAYYDGLMSNGTPTPLIHTMVSLIQKHPLAGAELIKDLLSAAKIVFAFINFLSTGKYLECILCIYYIFCRLINLR